jgi:hypothetical protein
VSNASTNHVDVGHLFWRDGPNEEGDDNLVVFHKK